MTIILETMLVISLISNMSGLLNNMVLIVSMLPIESSLGLSTNHLDCINK